MPLSPEKQWQVVLALGSAQTLAWGSTYYLPAILARPISAELGLTEQWFFGAFSLALLIWAVLGPAVGRRIDRFGGRGVLAVSNLVFCAGLVMLSQCTGAIGLFLAWSLLGVGMSLGLYEAGFAALTAIYGDKARSPITGITLLAGLASTIGWPIAAWLESRFGWRDGCLIWAASHLLIGLPLNYLLLPVGVHHVTTEDSSRPPVSMLSRPMLVLAFFFSVTAFVSMAMGAHLPNLLIAAGASQPAAIIAAGLMGPAQVAARILEFSFMQRFHPMMSAFLAAGCHPVAAAMLLLLGMPFLYVFAILHGAGNGLLTITRGTLPLALFGPSGYGYRQGLLTAPSRFLQAIAPLAFTYVIDGLGAMALAVSGLLALSGVLSLLLLRSGFGLER